VPEINIPKSEVVHWARRTHAISMTLESVVSLLTFSLHSDPTTDLEYELLRVCLIRL